MRLRVRVANLLKDQPMSRYIIYLGMDVHKESITIAVLPENAAAPTRVDRIPNDCLPDLPTTREESSAGELPRAQ